MKEELAVAPRAAEFFAGMGLVRMALEQAGCKVVFANDISATKQRIYEANFGLGEFLCADIRNVYANQIPQVEIATASFPCTDLSLAGNRAGLAGVESGLFREFHRILSEMEGRRPKTVILENVVGLATSKGGADLAVTISLLNKLGYICDLLMLDARWFVAQSRPRVFVVATLSSMTDSTGWAPSRLRPSWVGRFVAGRPELKVQAAKLPEPPEHSSHLVYYVDHYAPHHPIWWGGSKLESFLSSLSHIQARRLDALRSSDYTSFATAYRRTRHGRAVWEIRSDDISGCLRTGRGGSSRQALVKAGQGDVRVRWMTAREYARLQGAPEVSFGDATEAQSRFALGDAVCVPAVVWLLQNHPQILRDHEIVDAPLVTAYA